MGKGEPEEKPSGTRHSIRMHEKQKENERERGREGGGESARVIANDLVVSSTPRRIRRTSNSSADRYWVPGGLARWGASAGGSGWKK